MLIPYSIYIVEYDMFIIEKVDFAYNYITKIKLFIFIFIKRMFSPLKVFLYV